MVGQAVKKFLTFLWNPKVYYRDSEIPPLNDVLNHVNSVHSFLKLISILPCHLRLVLPSEFFPSGLSTKISYALSCVSDAKIDLKGIVDGTG